MEVDSVTEETFYYDHSEDIEFDAHLWNRNTSSTPIIVVCEVDGYYELLLDRCVEKLLPRNITCSEHNPGI